MWAWNQYMRQTYCLRNRIPGAEGYLYTGPGVLPFLFAEGRIYMCKLQKSNPVLISYLKWSWRCGSMQYTVEAELFWHSCLFFLFCPLVLILFKEWNSFVSFSTSVHQVCPFYWSLLAVFLMERMCLRNCKETTDPELDFIIEHLLLVQYPTCTLSSFPISSIGWLFLSVVEIILFVMILKKTGKDRLRWPSFSSSLRPKRHGVESVIFHDSTIYFVMYFIFPYNSKS